MQILQIEGVYLVRHEGKRWFLETLKDAFEWADWLLTNPKLPTC